MAKVLTVMPAILMLLWPILGASASSDYFYNSVTPPAEDHTTEKPLAVLPDCVIPPGNYLDPLFVMEALTIAYEVNGVSYCGGNGITGNGVTYVVWLLNIPSGTKIKIRYAARNTTSQLFECLSSNSMFLFLNAPAMGINNSYLTSQGQWQPSVLTFFRPAPPTSVWNDLYDDTPPKGDYVLYMGCDTQFKYGEIQFRIQ